MADVTDEQLAIMLQTFSKNKPVQAALRELQERRAHDKLNTGVDPELLKCRRCGGYGIIHHQKYPWWKFWHIRGCHVCAGTGKRPPKNGGRAAPATMRVSKLEQAIQPKPKGQKAGVEVLTALQDKAKGESNGRGETNETTDTG